MNNTDRIIRVLVVLVALATYFQIDSCTKFERTARAIPVKYGPVQTTSQPAADTVTPSADILAYWETRLKRPVMDLFDGKCAYPELGKRAKHLTDVVRKRYGCGVAVELCRDYSPIDRGVQGAAGYNKNGEPRLMLFIPALRDTVSQNERINRSTNHSALAGIFVIIIHELEHLSAKTRQALNLAEFVDGEVQAWAATCELAIMPVINSRSADIQDAHLRRMHRAWIRCGRNAASECWRTEIALLCAPAFRFHVDPQ